MRMSMQIHSMRMSSTKRSPLLMTQHASPTASTKEVLETIEPDVHATVIENLHPDTSVSQRVNPDIQATVMKKGRCAVVHVHATYNESIKLCVRVYLHFNSSQSNSSVNHQLNIDSKTTTI